MGPGEPTIAASDGPIDLLVIGAGINGTAIARDAALRGLRTVLIDQGDLGEGTSSWSSRLIHGGIRYLEHGEIRLVRESLHERERLLRNAPHLVRPFPLLIPYYAHNKRAPLTLGVGMLAYDALSFDKSTPWHQPLSHAAVRERYRGLDVDGLRGGALYYDAQCTWAERLCVENALDAAAAGTGVHTYTRAERLLRTGDRVIGARCCDLRTGRVHDVHAAATINAAGPWIDAVNAGLDLETPRLIGGTKGSHLVVDPFPGAPETGVHYEARGDGRAVLVLPWAGRYLIGSTDLYFEGDPGAIAASDDEIDYLLAETNRLIPGAGLGRDDVLFSYCGVRPLPHAPDAGSEADVSRDHVIHDHGRHAQGLLSIIGGKLTTHRALAEQTVDTVVRRLGRRRRPSLTRRLPLPGARTLDWEGYRARFVAESTLPDPMAERLLDVYGVRAASIAALAERDPDLGKEFAPNAPAAEVVHAFAYEHAVTLSDVLLRRSMLGLAPGVGHDVVESAADVAVRHAGLSVDDAADQVRAYRAHTTARLRPRVLEG